MVWYKLDLCTHEISEQNCIDADDKKIYYELESGKRQWKNIRTQYHEWFSSKEQCIDALKTELLKRILWRKRELKILEEKLQSL